MTFNERQELFKLQRKYINLMEENFLKDKNEAPRYFELAGALEPLHKRSYKEWRDKDAKDFM